jgi:phosphoglycolate phosphatase-like HAD superfamily hydrolase
VGGKLKGEEIVVIGDTPLDIACAQSIGAKVLAVGTGEYSAAELEKTGPTWAVDHVGQLDVRVLLGRD